MNCKKTYKLGNSIRVKLLLIISLFTLIAIFVVSIAFDYMSYTQMLGLIEQRNLQISKVVSNIVEGNYIQQIFNQEDNTTLGYKKLVETFNTINDDVEMGQLYIIVKQGEESYKAYMTNETEHFNIIKLEEKHKLPKELLEVFETGKESIVKGKYNIGAEVIKYNSAFSPILNNDEVVAIVGYEYRNEQFKNIIAGINVDIIHITIVLLLICMVCEYFILSKFFRPINELVEIINSATKGDMTVQMDITTLDEIGVVKQALNNNISTISKILNKIKTSSTHLYKASKSIFVSSRDGVDSFNELARSITKILDIVELQNNNQHEAMDILEGLSNDGNNISKYTQDINKQITIIQDILPEIKSDDKNLYNALKVIKEELYMIMISSEDYLGEMAEHIKQAFYNIDEAGQLVNNIGKDTKSVLQIVEEQIASSEEFVNMTNLLKVEAKKVNENIKKFKV